MDVHDARTPSTEPPVTDAEVTEVQKTQAPGMTPWANRAEGPAHTIEDPKMVAREEELRTLVRAMETALRSLPGKLQDELQRDPGELLSTEFDAELQAMVADPEVALISPERWKREMQHLGEQFQLTMQNWFDRLLSAAGLTGMDVSQAAFIVMMQATRDMDDDLRRIMAEIKAMTAAKQALRERIEEMNEWISMSMSEAGDPDDLDNAPMSGPGSPGGLITYRGSGEDGAFEMFVPTPDAESSGLVEYYETVFAGTKTIQRGRAVQERLRRELEAMNELSEMTSLRLQMTMDRRSKFISTLSRIMKRISTTQDMLVQNTK